MPRAARRYGVAVLAAFGAIALTLALRPFFSDTPLFPFLFAVLIGAWYGGYRAAALALVILISAGIFIGHGVVENQDLAARIITVTIAALVAAKLGRGFRRVAAQADQRAVEAGKLLSELEAKTQERKWLYSAEHEARLRAEAAERRFRFLASAGSQLAASATLGGTRQTLTRLLVEGIAEWAILADPDNDVPIAMHRDPELNGVVEGLALRCAEGDTSALCQTLRSKPASLEVHHPDARSDAPADMLLRELGTRSWMAIPIGENARYGVLVAGSLSEIDEEDVTLAKELASDATGAIATAQLIEVSAETARAKTDFLAIMSHELRTPLTAIIGYTDLLETGVTGSVSDIQRTQLTRIRASAWRLLGLIDEVLTYTKLQLGLGESHKLPVNIAQLARESAEHVRPLADSKGLAIQLDVPVALVQTDPYKVRHILDALVGNAVKFTDRGVVSIRGEIKDGLLIYEVQDTGVGIPEAAFEHIFQPFTQVEDALTRKFGGAGLGLALTHRLARLLGGELNVRSEIGQGSVFTVQLPVETVRNTRDLSFPSLTRASL